jgi:hypothetical protein
LGESWCREGVVWVMEGLETGAFEEAVDAGGIRIIDGGGCEDLFEVLDGFGEGLDGSGERGLRRSGYGG